MIVAYCLIAPTILYNDIHSLISAVIVDCKQPNSTHIEILRVHVIVPLIHLSPPPPHRALQPCLADVVATYMQVPLAAAAGLGGCGYGATQAQVSGPQIRQTADVSHTHITIASYGNCSLNACAMVNNHWSHIHRSPLLVQQLLVGYTRDDIERHDHEK